MLSNEKDLKQSLYNAKIKIEYMKQKNKEQICKILDQIGEKYLLDYFFQKFTSDKILDIFFEEDIRNYLKKKDIIVQKHK